VLRGAERKAEVRVDYQSAEGGGSPVGTRLLEPVELPIADWSIAISGTVVEGEPPSEAKCFSRQHERTAVSQAELSTSYFRVALSPIPETGGGTYSLSADRRGLIVEGTDGELSFPLPAISRFFEVGKLKFECKNDVVIQLNSEADSISMPQAAMYDGDSRILVLAGRRGIYEASALGASAFAVDTSGRVTHRLFLFQDGSYAIEADDVFAGTAAARRRFRVFSGPNVRSVRGAADPDFQVLSVSKVGDEAPIDAPSPYVPRAVLNRNPGQDVSCLAVSEEGTYAISIDSSRTVVSVWTTQAHALLRQIQVTTQGQPILSLAFAPSGRYAAVGVANEMGGSQKAILKVWDLFTGQKLLESQDDQPALLLRFQSDQTLLTAVGNSDSLAPSGDAVLIGEWDIKAGRLTRIDFDRVERVFERLGLRAQSISVPQAIRGFQVDESVDCNSWPVDSSLNEDRPPMKDRLVVRPANPSRVLAVQWSRSEGLSVQNKDDISTSLGRRVVSAKSISANSSGELLAIAGSDGTVRVFDTKDLNFAVVADDVKNPAVDVAFTAVSLTSLHRNGSVRISEPHGGGSIELRPPSFGEPEKLLIDPSGVVLAVASRGTSFTPGNDTALQQQADPLVPLVNVVALDSRNLTVLWSAAAANLDTMAGVGLAGSAALIGTDTLALRVTQIDGEPVYQLFKNGSPLTVRQPRFTGHPGFVSIDPITRKGYVISGFLGVQTDTSWEIVPLDVATANQMRDANLEGYSRPSSFQVKESFGAVGTENGEVLFFELASNTLRWTAVSERGAVQGLAFLNNGRVLATLYSSGAIDFLATQDGTRVGTLFLLPENKWLIYTQEGIFAESGGTEDYIHFTVGPESIAPIQVAAILRRPDLIRRFLENHSISLSDEEKGRLDLSLLLRAGSPPEVKLLPGAIPIDDGDSGEVEFKAELRDQGGGIGNLQLRLNGTRVGVQCLSAQLRETIPVAETECEKAFKQVSRREGQSGTVIVKLQLALVPGNNIVEMAAHNSENTILSRSDSASVQFGGNEPPRLFVLAMGVDKYPDRTGLKQLRHAVKDANDITSALEEAGKLFFERVYSKILRNDEVTRVRIAKAFTEILNGTSSQPKLRRSDVFILFLAGRGTTDANGGYVFFPHDFELSAGDTYTKALRSDFWADLINQLPTTKSLIIIDTCAGGSFIKDAPVRGASDARDAVARLQGATGRAYIVAARPNESASEGYRGNGILTGAILDGLSGAADVSPKNGFVSVAEIAAYVGPHVQSIAARQFHRTQSAVNLVVGNFDLGRVVGSRAIPTEHKSGGASVSTCTLQEQDAYSLAFRQADSDALLTFATAFPTGCFAGSAAALHSYQAYDLSARHRIASVLGRLGLGKNLSGMAYVSAVSVFQAATGRPAVGALSSEERAVIFSTNLIGNHRDGEESLGLSSDQITRLKFELAKRGFTVFDITPRNTFTPSDRYAIFSFQRSAGRIPTGYLTSDDVRELANGVAPSSQSGKPKGRLLVNRAGWKVTRGRVTDLEGEEEGVACIASKDAVEASPLRPSIPQFEAALICSSSGCLTEIVLDASLAYSDDEQLHARVAGTKGMRTLQIFLSRGSTLHPPPEHARYVNQVVETHGTEDVIESLKKARSVVLEGRVDRIRTRVRYNLSGFKLAWAAVHDACSPAARRAIRETDPLISEWAIFRPALNAD
jgi:WD40 repeat protein